MTPETTQPLPEAPAQSQEADPRDARIAGLEDENETLRARVETLEADRASVAERAVEIAASQGVPVAAALSPISGTSEGSEKKGYLRLLEAVTQSFRRR